MIAPNSVEAAYQVSLVTSNILCTTVFGYLLVFSTVVMPGIGKLPDGDFLRAFQVIDGVIQNNEPIFVASWMGSILSILASAGLATAAGNGDSDQNGKVLWTWLACATYLIGQVITWAKNIPLNNRLQTLSIHELDSFNKHAERQRFEGPWRSWNNIRTVLFLFTTTVMHILLLNADPAV